MIRRTKLFGWTVSLGLLASSALAVDIEKIEGEASWDGSDPVPRGAMLEVDLIDLSRDGSGVVLSRMRFKPESSTPLPFTLHYDAELVRQGDRYSLAARLVRGDDVLFRSRAPVPVLRTFQRDRPQINLEPVAPVVAGGTPVGQSWRVVSIAGQIPRRVTRIHISFDEDGTAKGSFGCNKFKADYVVDGPKFELKRINATNRGCQPAIATQERAVRAAYNRTATYERSGDSLILLDGAGLETLRFERQ